MKSFGSASQASRIRLFNSAADAGRGVGILDIILHPGPNMLDWIEIWRESWPFKEFIPRLRISSIVERPLKRSVVLICYKVINDGDGSECDVCGMLAHRECHGVAEKGQEDFMCSACQGNIVMKNFSQEKSTSRLAALKLDKGKGEDMADVDDEIDDEDEEAENTESEGEADYIEQPSIIELDESYHGTDGGDSNSGEDLEGPKPNKSRFVPSSVGTTS